MADFDPFAVQRGFQTTQNLFDQARQNKLAEMAMQRKQREIEQEDEANRLFAAAVGPDGAIDRSKLVTGFAQSGLGSRIPSLQADFSKQDKAQREAEKARLESIAQNVQIQAQLLGGVRDDATYQAAKQAAAEAGIDVSKLPQQYDPNFIQQARARALSAAQQIEQEWKQKKFDQDERQFEAQQETQRRGQDITVRGQDMYAATARRGQDMTDARAREKNNGKPLPTAALKMQQEAVDAIGTVGSINADLKAIDQQIQSGKLDFGPVSNIVNQARNAVGMSSEESRNFSSFKSTLEKLRNDSLRLNKGVQTEGDAQRAWNELFSNINDKKLVQQRLAEIQAINDRAANLRRLEVDTIRRNYGAEPLETEQFASQPAAIGRAPAGQQKSVVRTGTYNGRKVVQYSDGTVEYQ